MRTLLTLASIVILFYSTLCSSLAFDLNTCKQAYPNRVEAYRQYYRLDRDAGVSFGDDPYNLLFHYPRGDFVICWLTDGSVAIHGLLFVESWRTGKIKIRFHRYYGGYTGITWRTQYTPWGPVGVSAKLVIKHRKDLDQGPYDRVEIKLYKDYVNINNGEGWITYYWEDAYFIQ